MLFYSVFQTFHRKNDSSIILKSLNPEGPLGSNLCDVTLLAFWVSFLCNKESQQNFLSGEKNLIFLSFLRSKFLISCFLCSFIIPFMKIFLIFIKSIFNFLLFFTINLRHMFTRLSYWSWSCSVWMSCIIISSPGQLMPWSVVYCLSVVSFSHFRHLL